MGSLADQLTQALSQQSSATSTTPEPKQGPILTPRPVPARPRPAKPTTLTPEQKALLDRVLQNTLAQIDAEFPATPALNGDDRPNEGDDFYLTSKNGKLYLYKDRRQGQGQQAPASKKDTVFHSTVTTADGEKFTIPLSEAQRDALAREKIQAAHSERWHRTAQTWLTVLGAVALGIGVVAGVRADANRR